MDLVLAFMVGLVAIAAGLAADAHARARGAQQMLAEALRRLRDLETRGDLTAYEALVGIDQDNRLVALPLRKTSRPIDHNE